MHYVGFSLPAIMHVNAAFTAMNGRLLSEFARDGVEESAEELRATAHLAARGCSPSTSPSRCAAIRPALGDADALAALFCFLILFPSPTSAR